MVKIVAICTDIETFNNNRLLDKEFSKSAIGACWVYLLNELLQSCDIKVVTGDVAIKMIETKQATPENVLIIQELDAKHGKILVNKGAYPFILTGFESPIYAYKFYDQLNIMCPKFKHRILYSGAFKEFPKNPGQTNTQVFFPAYFQAELPEIKPWSEKKEIVMVVANKFCKKARLLSFKPRKWRLWIEQTLSKNLNYSLKHELQSNRLEAIKVFEKLKKLDLYGHSWNKLRCLPLIWRFKLRNSIKNLKPKPCDDKIKTMSDYKFAICFENVAYPGHITEKIIDCFIAGVIPIYLGAPDIENFIPKDAFIDMRKFKTFEDLNEYLSGISEEKTLEIIKAGKRFLESKEGKQYSYEGFAEFIKNLILESGKNEIYP